MSIEDEIDFQWETGGFAPFRSGGAAGPWTGILQVKDGHNYRRFLVVCDRNSGLAIHQLDHVHIPTSPEPMTGCSLRNPKKDQTKEAKPEPEPEQPPKPDASDLYQEV